ncbi:MAG: Unknown protein, partial [uncultured Sulfurovum sp.]
MKNKLLKLSLATLMLLGVNTLQATKMTSPITHGIPWIETRLPYSMTIQELAEIYYGDPMETQILLKMNKLQDNGNLVLYKNMKILVPVTRSFKDQ